MNSILNVLNLRDLWVIKVWVSSRQLEAMHRIVAKGRFLLQKQVNERTIGERVLKGDLEKMTERVIPDRLENQELACCHENPREGELPKRVSKSCWRVKKVGIKRCPASAEFTSAICSSGARSFCFHSLLSARSPHQWDKAGWVLSPLRSGSQAVSLREVRGKCSLSPRTVWGPQWDNGGQTAATSGPTKSPLMLEHWKHWHLSTNFPEAFPLWKFPSCKPYWL